MSVSEPDQAAKRPWRHLAYFVLALGVAVVGYASIAVAAHMAQIPPPFSESIAVNKKWQFVKDNRPQAPAAIVLGSSLAMFNLDTDRLAAEEGHPFINLGAYGLNLADMPQIYHYYQQVMPISEVMLLTNYFELRRSNPKLTTSETTIVRYLRGDMSLAEESTYRDWSSLRTYLAKWDELHARVTLNSVAFDRTGAVSVDAEARTYDVDYESARNMKWEAGCDNCMAPVETLCRSVRAQNRRFTLVLTPTRPKAIDGVPGLQAMKADRKVRARRMIERCGGELIDMGEAPFEDACFVDVDHLNARGMARLADVLAKYRAGDPLAVPTDGVRCG